MAPDRKPTPPKPSAIPIAQPYAPPPRVRCPYCQSGAQPWQRSREHPVALALGLALAVAGLVYFWPLLLAGLLALIAGRQKQSSCRDCGMKLG
jgi:hypothetical protein